MKKYALAGSLLMAGVITIILSCNDQKPKPEAALETSGGSDNDSMAAMVARGKYLAYSVVSCVDCHSQLDVEKFSMPIVPGTEGGGGLALHEVMTGFPGKLFIPNITPTTLGNWTDDEIARAVTRGINKSGDTLFPMMPFHYLSRLAPEDLRSIIAFIRTLKPIEKVHPKKELVIPMSVFGPLPDKDYRNNTRPDSSDKVKYGEYLVTIAHCGECHHTRDKTGMPIPGKMFAGGNTEPLIPFQVTSANITPDSATGIGEWSELMFLAKFRTNASPQNLQTKPGKFNTIMPWSFFGTMTDNDLKSIYAYLRTVPPVRQVVVKWK
jgi:mono/diheme cytochrome c family protein